MPKKLHSFSIIIPAYNEKDYIADCVKSLARQDYRGKFEIIVVDNASTDKTAKIAEEAGAKIVFEAEKNVSQARRKGSSEALGEILAYTDADSKLPPDWISRMNKIFNSSDDIVAAGGLFRFDEVGLTVNLLANKIFLPINGLVMKYFITPRVPFLTGSNMAVRREAYEKCGGFDPKFPYGEDNELATRLAKVGKVYFDPDLIVKTSFRRYSGGHKSIFFVLPKAIKETFVTIYRFFLLKSKNKAFSAQSAVRERGFGSFKKLENNRKAVSLTFDDGPYGNATEKILDILKEKEVKATFFLLGNNTEKYPEIVRRAIEEGHIVANHSHDHSRMLPLITSKKFMVNVTNTGDAIEKASGLRPRLFRFPFGIGTPWMKKSLKSQGYTFIPLGIMTNDYNNARAKPEKITAYILKRLRPGSIITLHDGRDKQIEYPRENVIKALPAIIDGIRNKGFEITPLDQLLGEKSYF